MEKLYYLNENGGMVEFSMRSLYHVNVSVDVDGLSDVKSRINTTSTLGQDGETYVSSSIEPRSIDITGHLHTLNRERQADLRRNLNHVLNPKLAGTLIYAQGEFRRTIACRAETAPDYKPGKSWPQFNVDLFCPSPFWQEASGEQFNQVSAWEALLEFDEDGLELFDGWEIGQRMPDLIITVPNRGDVDCGIRIRFEAQGTVVNPVLLNVETNEYIKLNMVMQAGDVVEVTTSYGNKKAILTRNSARSNIFRLVDGGTTFLHLTVGDNLFKCTADSGRDDLNVSLHYNKLYLGV